MIGISEELKNTDPDLLSPLTLAFIGDTVFDLLVRGNLVMQANRPVGKLYHSATGLEALFGWLYLSGQDKRIEELFEHISNAEKADEVK